MLTLPKKLAASILFFSFFLTLTQCSQAEAPKQEPAAEDINGSLQIKGSDTMVNLGQAWAEEFMVKYPNASIAVTGGGSGTGIAAIINGTCDIAQCSRAMKEQEIQQAKAKGRVVEEIEVAIDALEVIVNPANPVSQLTTDQLSDIFTGKVTNWKDVGGGDQPILVLSRERNSGTHVYFLEHIVRKGNDKGPEEFSPKALMLPSSQAITDEVGQSATAIGYVGMGYVTEKQKKVAIGKTAAGPFVLPSVESAKDGSYPIARPLLMYTQKEKSGIVKTFLDFVLSEKGQEIVQQMDFVPLSKKE